MGVADEWLGLDRIERQRLLAAEEHYRTVLEEGMGTNGVSAIKVMPPQWSAARASFGYDFVQRCLLEHDTYVVLLERRDVLGAAISATRALQTGEWTIPTTGSEKVGPRRHVERYDSRKILENLLHISEGIAFWRYYLTARCVSYHHVFYEDVIENRSAYVNSIAAGMGLSLVANDVSDDQYQVQRDQLTEEWKRMYMNECNTIDIFPNVSENRRYPRTIANFCNFLLGRRLIQRDKRYSSNPPLF